MLLDIVIPHYRESWDVVRPAVQMLHNQRGVDFEEFRVMLVHDGVEPFQDEWLAGPADIRQICLPKGGVSEARNYGIDHSDAEWINFSDCDDCYSSVLSLMMILHVLRQDIPFDMMWSPYWMIYKERLARYVDYTPVFIHNKYYRTSFLKEKEIRFCEKLYMSEDSAFNAIVESRIGQGRVGRIDAAEPLYAWCRRDDSVTLDPSRKLVNAIGHFNRNLYVVEECFRKGDLTAARLMTARTLTDAYAQLTRPGLEGDMSDVLRRVGKFYLENREVFTHLSDADFKRMMDVSDLEAGNDEEQKCTRPEMYDWFESLPV